MTKKLCILLLFTMIMIQGKYLISATEEVLDKKAFLALSLDDQKSVIKDLEKTHNMALKASVCIPWVNCPGE